MKRPLTFEFVRLSETATAPTRGSKCAAGWDLYANFPNPKDDFMMVGTSNNICVPTGISFSIAPGYYGRIASRSGLSLRNGIEVGAGVIDSDYRGEVRVVLYNHSSMVYTVRHGDKIAQIIFTKYSDAELKEVKELSETKRGDGGFGSTGL